MKIKEKKEWVERRERQLAQFCWEEYVGKASRNKMGFLIGMIL